MLASLLPAESSRIAELGCGTGSLAVLLAQEGHQASGLDLAPRMVDNAKKKARAARFSVVFTVGDAAQPPWSPKSFDVVLCRHVLWALSDPGPPFFVGSACSHRMDGSY